MLSVSIDRTSLSLSALVINDYPGAGLWLPEDALQRPAKAQRLTYAADSPFVHGSLLTSAVLLQSSLPMSVKAGAATTAALEDLMDELEAALFQFTYDVTVTVDGSPRVWRADPADIGWGTIDSGEVAARIATASVTIPVYPVSA